MASEKIGVVGCGTMGAGIAIACANAGLDTTVVEVSSARMSDGMKRIEAYFTRGVEKGKLSAEDKGARLGRIHATVERKTAADCDFVIEAIVEDLDAKKRLFGELHHACKPDTILVSNTSTLSITSIASGCGRPDKVVGIHFCNPVPLMPAVEVARGIRTSDDTFQKAKSLCDTLGKKTVVTKDTPGFLTNFFLVSLMVDAVRLYEGGLASPADIDKACKLGLAHPMGPFELMDTAGLDVCYTVALSMYEQTKDPRYAPPPLMKRMVDAGLLGRKSGRGFYEYAGQGMFGA